MMRLHRCLPGLLILLLWIGCSPAPQPVTRNTTQMQMGTLVSIVTWELTVQPDQWREQEARIVGDAFREMARVESIMSSHKNATPVQHVNAGPRGTLQPIPSELAGLLRTGLEITRLSNGAFDMGLQPLTSLWGFSRDDPASHLPDIAQLNTLVEQHHAGGLTLTGDTEGEYRIRLDHAGTGLDLGAIAKGYAIDQAAQVLDRAGVRNYIITAGGDMRMAGAKGNRSWRVGIQHPREPAMVMAVVEPHATLAMATSGDYERFFIQDGIRYHHILDPKTGWPARSGIIAVSVQAPNNALADALSTTLFVLGAEAGLALLEKFPGCEAYLVLEDGTHKKTAGFVGQRLDPPQKKVQ
ncbi:MAG: FAD:protein FMN transferase [Magnetococcus sp. DMHC-1]|nr:FAD:protein FMN transferase [Magnetococcales bacterium]